MTELKITTERVLEAAATCPQAKQVLEKLFSEAFASTQDPNIIPLHVSGTGRGRS